MAYVSDKRGEVSITSSKVDEALTPLEIKGKLKLSLTLFDSTPLKNV